MTLWIRALMVAATLGVMLGSTQAGAEIGLIGGLHGGSMHHAKVDEADAIKGGLIGLNYGYQVGVDVGLGPLWFTPMFMANNVWISDYQAGNPPPDVRYANTGVSLPLMYRIRKGTSSGGLGVFYRHPLSDAADQDSGLALGFSVGAKGRLYGNFLMLGSLREQAQGGAAIQGCLNLGIRLK